MNRWSRVRSMFAAVCATLVLASVVSARQEPVNPARISRIDLINAYDRLDAQFMLRLADGLAEPPEGVQPDSDVWREWTLQDVAELERLNLQVDRAAASFLGGDLGRVVFLLNSALAVRPGDASDAQFLALARSLHLEIDPARPSVRQMSEGGDFDGECTFRVSSIYPLPEGVEAPQEAGLMIVFNETGSSTSSINQLMLSIDASRRVSGAVTAHLDGPWRAGTREIKLRSGEMRLMGFAFDQPPQTFAPIGRWTVLPEALDEAQRRLGARLDAAGKADAAQEQRLAQALLRQRLTLLEDPDSRADTTGLLIDYSELIGSLDRECTMIEAGIDPYSGRSGDTWHGVPLGEELYLPARIYVPAEVDRQGPMPLVIALHGAGGDENFFMEAGGDGVIKRLADERGFVVVSPQASPLMDVGLAFDSIVALMQSLYDIDEKRIYVLGHSMGAMMTGGISAARHDRIAAACWLAGASYSRGSTIPPTLAVAAELDSIIVPSRVEAVVAEAKRGGMDVEYRRMEHYGHVLMIGPILPEVLDWLLARRR